MQNQVVSYRLIRIKAVSRLMDHFAKDFTRKRPLLKNEAHKPLRHLIRTSQERVFMLI